MQAGSTILPLMARRRNSLLSLPASQESHSGAPTALSLELAWATKPKSPKLVPFPIGMESRNFRIGAVKVF